MKKLALLFVFVQSLVFAQGEQRYADGTATDQDGNTFEWINYGTQDWAIENAAVVTYRDGTPIPQGNLTTGAWAYYNNDPTKPKLYNWYAVMGIHDTDPNTPNKEFAPEGWHVPSDSEWTTLEKYLIANGYNYDGTTKVNNIAKAMASTTGWNSYNVTGVIGNDQSLNNSSGFNAFPEGNRYASGTFNNEGNIAFFWSSTRVNSYAWDRSMNYWDSNLGRSYTSRQNAYSVRFVRDASTASTMDFSNTVIIYPNPTSSLLVLNSDKEYYIEVYNMAGNKVMVLTGNSINMEHLSTATYIVRATDKSNNEELTYKVVKN